MKPSKPTNNTISDTVKNWSKFLVSGLVFFILGGMFRSNPEYAINSGKIFFYTLSSGFTLFGVICAFIRYKVAAEERAQPPVSVSPGTNP